MSSRTPSPSPRSSCCARTARTGRDRSSSLPSGCPLPWCCVRPSSSSASSVSAGSRSPAAGPSTVAPKRRSSASRSSPSPWSSSCSGGSSRTRRRPIGARRHRSYRTKCPLRKHRRSPSPETCQSGGGHPPLLCVHLPLATKAWWLENRGGSRPLKEASHDGARPEIRHPLRADPARAEDDEEPLLPDPALQRLRVGEAAQPGLFPRAEGRGRLRRPCRRGAVVRRAARALHGVTLRAARTFADSERLRISHVPEGDGQGRHPPGAAALRRRRQARTRGGLRHCLCLRFALVPTAAVLDSVLQQAHRRVRWLLRES